MAKSHVPISHHTIFGPFLYKSWGLCFPTATKVAAVLPLVQTNYSQEYIARLDSLSKATVFLLILQIGTQIHFLHKDHTLTFKVEHIDARLTIFLRPLNKSSVLHAKWSLKNLRHKACFVIASHSSAIQDYVYRNASTAVLSTIMAQAGRFFFSRTAPESTL